MRTNPELQSRDGAKFGCMLLGGTVDSSNVYSQDAAAEAGLIEAATEAMRSFP